MKTKIVLLILSLMIFYSCGQDEEKKFLTTKVQYGNLDDSLNVAGVVEPVYETTVSTPTFASRFQIIDLILEGAKVNQGDTIAKLDPSDFETTLEKIELELENMEEQIIDLKSEFIEKEISLSNKLEEAKDILEIEKIKLDSAEFLSSNDQKEIKIRVRQKENDVEIAKGNIKLAKQIHQRKLNQLSDKKQNKISELKKIKKQIKNLVIKAPQKGIVVYKNRHPYSTEKIALGDQLRRGHVFMSIPDLEKMKVVIEINEINISRIKKNMYCKVTLDAFPEINYDAVITKIGYLAHGKKSDNLIKVFDVEASFQEFNIPNLRPGMAAKVDIIIDSYKNVAHLPIDCIFQKNNNRANILVYDKGKLQNTQIEILAQNHNFIIFKPNFSSNLPVLFYNEALLEKSNIKAKQIIEKKNNDRDNKTASKEDKSSQKTNSSLQTNRKNNSLNSAQKIKNEKKITTNKNKKTQKSVAKSKENKKQFSMDSLKSRNPELYQKIINELKKRGKTIQDLTQDSQLRREIMGQMRGSRKK